MYWKTRPKKTELKLTLPSVRTYISLTALVARFFKGFPLKPPPSFLFWLFKDEGRFTVVLVTINPSTRVLKENAGINYKFQRD